MKSSSVIIIFGLIMSGLITTTSLIGGSIYLINHYNDFNCGNLNMGLIIGLGSIISFIFNITLYCLNCVKSFIVPGLLVIGSLIYNCYLYNKLSNNCIQHYKQNDLLDIYNYYIISLGILTLFLIIFTIYKCVNI